MKIYKKITDLVGRTPLFELENFAKIEGLEATVLGKLEFFLSQPAATQELALLRLGRLGDIKLL